MQREDALKLNNKGLSLVELIVTILLMSAVMGIILIFISSSRNVYQVVETQAGLQTEAEIAKSFISELAVEATDVGTFTYSDNSASGIWILAPDNSYSGLNTVTDASTGTTSTVSMDYKYYFILLEKANSVLRYCTLDDEDTRLLDASGNKLGTGVDYAALFSSEASGGTGTYGDPYSLLAEHVTGISCSVSQTSLISIVLNLEYNSTAYTTTINVAGRNIKD